jgi:hypothetical protein
MTKAFHFGKKYLCPSNNMIFTCVGTALGGKPVMQSNQHTAPFVPISPETWKEYVEPAKRTWWINIYKNPRTNELICGSIHESKESALNGYEWLIGENRKYLETTEFTYTEKGNA